MDLTAGIERTRRDLLELTARNRLVHTPLDGKRKSWIQIAGEKTDSVFDRLVRQGRSLAFESGEDDDDTATELGNLEGARPQHFQSADGDQLERQLFVRAFDAETGDAEKIDSAGFESRDNQRLEDDSASVAESVAGLAASSEKPLRDESPAEMSGRQDRAGYLRTRLGQDKLQSQLLRCLYDARAAEEEQGVSILYLACGFLKWTEAANPSTVRYAPLLLVPVELTRNTARSRFRLRFRDDEIVTNLSIQARLLQDFGIRLPDLPESPADDDEWAPSVYFDEVRSLLANRDGWEVLDDEILLWFFSFTKFLMFRDLSPQVWPVGRELEKHPIICGLLGHCFSDDSCMPPICSDDEPIDASLSPADAIHVTDADSSQAIVIAEIASGRNLVVQGPPGTGKSQTITNAIAAAVHAGKRVLFVSEKMAALDVVRRRLGNIGLGSLTLELHSHKARKRHVLEELKSTIEQGIPTGNKSVPIDELRTTVERLRKHSAVLHEPIGAAGVTPFHAMGQLLRLRAAGYPAMQFAERGITNWTPEQIQVSRSIATELDGLLPASGIPKRNPWYGTQCQPLTPGEQQRLHHKLNGALSSLTKLPHASSDLAEQLRLMAPTSLVDVDSLIQLADHLLNCPQKIDRSACADPAWQSQFDRIVQAIESARALKLALDTLQDRIASAAWSVDWSSTRIAIAAYGNSWFRFLNGSYRKAIAMLRGVCVGRMPKGREPRVQLIDSIVAIQNSKRELERNQPQLENMLGSLWQSTNSDFDAIDRVLAWHRDALKHPFVASHAGAAIAREIEQPRIALLLSLVTEPWQSVDKLLAEIASTLRLNTARSLGSEDPTSASMHAWAERLSGWLSAPDQLSHYLAIESRITKLQACGLADFARKVIEGNLPAGQVADQFEGLLAEDVLARAWQERLELAEFHGDAFDKLRERFAVLDQQRIALSRLEVAKKHHADLPLAQATSGQVSLLKREINKKRCHLPLRKLIKLAGEAIQRIKPVFMMSPLSVAQYLEPGAVDFDLLVIDEASQVQPVDALGAIARCKQIVVVGDQRQLPPSNFFGRMAGDESTEEDGDESINAGDLESILGLCEAQGLPSRMLRWHYRSRHESLIAVSNRQFYDDRLYIVPSPFCASESLGLKLRYISDGWYDRGGTRVNRSEAIAVANAVLEHAELRPQQSLGVVTFSVAQRDAIIDELEIRRRANPALEDFFSLTGAAPFFVKSLENVQGDERDVIYISVGYAKDRNGYFAQNFGPLNKKGGERRLNVLISRASAACEVFTSLKSEEIDLSRTSSEGIAALKSYLHYAENGTLDRQRSSGCADGLFEEQVAQTLRNHGLEVEHRIGIGDFFIDLAIRDPARSGRYLLGIDCDGAQYNNARWVRDRDRLRQEILDSRGWLTHRIWSADWFQRPDEQLQRVLAAVAKAKKHWKIVDQADAETATALSARRLQPDMDVDSFWERVDDHPDESVGESREWYTAAKLPTQEPVSSVAELAPKKLQSLIATVVDKEAPIHIDELGRRCIALVGRGRFTSALRNKLEAAIQTLADRNKIERRGDFLYRPGQLDFPVRNRSNMEQSSLRKAENIAPEELKAAIVTIVRTHIGTNETETASSVARLLGISNNKTLHALVREQIEQLTNKNAIEDRAGRLFVG